MGFPEYVIHLDVEGEIVERRCSASVYTTSHPCDETNIMTELVLSSGRLDDVGLYADIYYHTPVPMTDEEREEVGDDSLYKVRCERYARMWFLSPDEAKDVLSICEGATQVAIRAGDELLDLRRINILARRYVVPSDVNGLTDLVCDLYDRMRSDFESRSAAEGEKDIDEAIAEEMGLDVERLESFIASNEEVLQKGW